MEESNSPDHLSSSLTDLMTSLMVIFILLLLVFVQRTAGKDAAVAEVLLKRLKEELTDSQDRKFSNETFKQDGQDPNTILIVVPDRLMNFETGSSSLRSEGESFLGDFVPKFANIVCAVEFRSSVESVVVEGHTDTQSYTGLTPEESRNQNLKLSQDRSMEVVKASLRTIDRDGGKSGCFLEKLSASGRGEQEQEATPSESRRVIFKIRVRFKEDSSIKAHIP